MKISLANSLLNSQKQSPANFSIKQNRLVQLEPILQSQNSLLNDKKNLSFKISFSLETLCSSPSKAEFFALNHAVYLNSLNAFPLQFYTQDELGKTSLSCNFNNAILNSFSFEIVNNSAIFSYLFYASKMEI